MELLRLQFFRLSVFVIFVFVSDVWATNGLFPTFMGARGGGRGGVDFAIASDATAINTNPAGIAFIPGKMADFNFGAFYPSIHIENMLNDNDSHTEFAPYGSFGMVWDELDQILEVAVDPISYTFGGEVRYSNAPSAGLSSLTWEATQIPKEIIMEVTGNKSILSNIRVYGEVHPSPTVLWHLDEFPTLPGAAQLLGVRVQFEWTKSRAEPVKLILNLEGKESHVVLNGEKSQWKQGYLAATWEKFSHPAYISLYTSSEKSGLQMRNVRIAINYRFGERHVWKEIYCNEGDLAWESAGVQNILLASDENSYGQNQAPQKIVVKPISNLTQYVLRKIHLFYSYELQVPRENSFLDIHVQADKEEVSGRLHLPPSREETPSGTLVSRSKADFEVPHPQRPDGFKFGFGFFPQTGGRFTIKVTEELFPEGIENRVNQTFVSLAPAIAYRFNDSLSIGVALNVNLYLMELDGITAQSSLILKGTPNGLPPGSLTFGEALVRVLSVSHIRAEIDGERLFSYGFGGRIGLMWKINEHVQVGAVYSPKTWMQKTKGEVFVDFSRHFQSNPIFALLAGLTLPNQGRYGFGSKYDMEMDFNLPQRAGGGVAFLLADRLSLGVDFQWIDYSDTMKEIELIFENGSNVDMVALATPRVEGVVNAGWKDQYVVAVGMVWQPIDSWIIRCGYNYGTNPVPKEYLNPQFPGIIEHHVMMGTTYIINPHVQLHTAVEWGLPAKLESGGVNKFHPQLTNTDLKIYTLAAIFGVSWSF